MGQFFLMINGLIILLFFAALVHMRQRHDLIGCSETRTVCAQSVYVL